MWALCWLQGSADSNYSQPSSDLSLDEEKETLRREKERQALNQLEKARVSWVIEVVLTSTDNLVIVSAGGEEASWSGGKHSTRSSNLSVSKTLSDNSQDFAVSSKEWNEVQCQKFLPKGF
jgi:hypothetical protein